MRQTVEARQEKAQAVSARKRARAESKTRKSAELLQRGSTISNLLRHESQLAKLTVHDVMSALAFRGVPVPKGAKKPELLNLLRANFLLPSSSNIPASPVDEVQVHDAGFFEG